MKRLRKEGIPIYGERYETYLKTEKLIEEKGVGAVQDVINKMWTDIMIMTEVLSEHKEGI